MVPIAVWTTIAAFVIMGGCAIFVPPVPRDPYAEASYAAEQWLKANLRDPDSLEIINTAPVSNGDIGALITVQYRAKNGFGGYNVETKLFLVKGFKVVETSDVQ